MAESSDIIYGRWVLVEENSPYCQADDIAGEGGVPDGTADVTPVAVAQNSTTPHFPAALLAMCVIGAVAVYSMIR